MFYGKRSYHYGDKIKPKKTRSLLKSINAAKIDKQSSFYGEVVHSFTDLYTALRFNIRREAAIVECIIPKGEYYWKNEFEQEYASLSLVISRVVYYQAPDVKLAVQKFNTLVP